MNNTLTRNEVKRLSTLTRLIMLDLSCNLNCRTCRLDAVELMKKYLKIHDYEVFLK